MKIPPVRAELFCVDRQADGQTDMMKLIVIFHNFVNTPEGTIEAKVTAEINEFNYLGCSV